MPFGKGRATGYVLGPDPAPDVEKIRVILDVLDETPLFPPSMVPFYRWIAAYYLYPLGEVIRTALPGGINPVSVSVYATTEKGRQSVSESILAPLEKEILARTSRAPASHKQLAAALGKDLPHATLQAMARRGLLERERRLEHGRTRQRLERFAAFTPDHPDPQSLTPAGLKILELLRTRGEISYRELRDLAPSTTRLAKPMAAGGYLTLFDRVVYRDPFGDAIKADQPLDLTVEQERALPLITQSLGKGFDVFLLAGVTGSGKTELYLQSAAQALNQGRTVLVLVPEIVLISQTERRFRARFGEKVAVLHSGLAAGERLDQWMRIVAGRTPIVIGARSAVFAPLTKLGLVVVDEEHDPSYKQEGGLHYHGRDLAVMRAKLEGAVALLGSATPSLESRFNVEGGKYREVRLRHRVHRQPLPDIQVVDLRKYRRHPGSLDVITPPLKTAIKETLGRKEQVLLFLNRRGYANYPVCSACGEAVRCRHCDISLTFHQHNSTFQCHYCGFNRRALVRCPNCGALGIKLMGLGTEKVETVVRGLFPLAAVARMDRDTTRRKGELVRTLKKLRNREIDLLIGTQMVAKGHDFPHITLVGIICADLSLNFPDFRSGERTFQLLAQVAGRAGRGGQPGRVVMQTYNPDHFSIQAAKTQDPEVFYTREIPLRGALKYPPYSRMVQLKLQGRDPDLTRDSAQRLKSACLEVQNQDQAFGRRVQILGPLEAPLPRIANRYRWQMLIKGAGSQLIHRFLEHLMTDHGDIFSQRAVAVTVDVDPVSLM